jgi:hypothetical protein
MEFAGIMHFAFATNIAEVFFTELSQPYRIVPLPL